MGIEKMKGKAKKVAAKMKHEVGILSTLQGEHGEVSSLMSQLRKKAGDGNGADLHARNSLFQKIRSELLIHARAEQEVFYGACKTHPDLHDRIQHAEREHREIEQLLDQLSTMALDAPTWMDTFGQLKERVEHHVHEEEHEVFPRAKRILGDDELRRLDDEYGSERQQVERSIPPMQPPGGRYGEQRI